MVGILLAVLMRGFCLQLIYLNIMFYVDCIRFFDTSRKYYQCFDQNYCNVWSKNPNQFRRQLLILNITHFYRLR